MEQSKTFLTTEKGIQNSKPMINPVKRLKSVVKRIQSIDTDESALIQTNNDLNHYEPVDLFLPD